MKSEISKSDLRKTLRVARDLLDQKLEKSLIIEEYLFNICIQHNFSKILTYINSNSEVETLEFVERLLDRNIAVYLPYCEGLDLKAVKVSNLEDLKARSFGLLEPDPEKIDFETNQIDGSELDAVIVPGLGFDLQGNRIGYGKGFYDRYLEQCVNAVVIGICFEDQIVTNIPTEDHDKKMDYLISEISVRRIAR